MSTLDSSPSDPFNLDRFLAAQEDYYAQALSELRRGRKQTHWIWFIFPQIDGLGETLHVEAIRDPQPG